MDDMQNYVDQISKLTKQNNSWSAQQAQKQMDFQERMSNTAHVREIADLKAAGLNPVLSAKLGGASTPSGSIAEADTSGSGAIATLFDRMMENNSARELKELTLQHDREMQAQKEQHDIDMERMKQEFQIMMLNAQNATQAVKSSGGSGGSGSGTNDVVIGGKPTSFEREGVNGVGPWSTFIDDKGNFVLKQSDSKGDKDKHTPVTIAGKAANVVNVAAWALNKIAGKGSGTAAKNLVDLDKINNFLATVQKGMQARKEDSYKYLSK